MRRHEKYGLVGLLQEQLDGGRVPARHVDVLLPIVLRNDMRNAQRLAHVADQMAEAHARHVVRNRRVRRDSRLQDVFDRDCAPPPEKRENENKL